MADSEKPSSSVQFLDRPDGETIAYHFSGAKSPAQNHYCGVVFLGGFMSDMSGTKATTLEAHCKKTGRPFVRFDYMGHGQSSGRFVDGTIGRWREDTLAILDEVIEGPVVLVGSSMGGWISLLAALARPERVTGLVCVAPAPDFTEELMWPALDDDARYDLETTGVTYQISEYADEPYVIALRLIEEGRNHLLLQGPIAVTCPVRVLQGMEDPHVPWPHAQRLVEKLESRDVVLSLVKSGDHRLSEPDDLVRLTDSIDELTGKSDVN
ncbi:MAG TPA: alpha/beta hydrolase [Sneathiellales bacterium]|nr:alpha/beta hydrolase [Sneathiellales bacterium]